MNNLIMNQGIVKQSTIENNTILVNNYSGRGTVQYQGRVTEGVLTATGAKITIENAALGSSLVIASASDGTNTLDKNKAAESLESLAAKLVYTGDTKNLAAEAVINEGLITPRTKGSIVYDVQGNASVDTSTVHWEADKVDSGNESTETPGTPGTTETTTMSAMKNIAAVNLMAWREENNNLTKRLGDLRISDQEQGLWARMYRGEFEYSGTYKNQHNTFQIGYDKKISQKDGSSWFVGGAVSHTDGKTSYTNGNGENKSNGLAVYGTWLGTKGHYLDLIVKQSRLSTDFDTYVEAGHTHGDYNNWGTSLSTEYGRRLQLKNAWFVEPQVEFTIGRISSADYTTNNDIMVSQDALYSKVGRVGFRIGKALTKKSQIYAYGSLLHEFGSDGHTYLKLNGISNSYLQEIGNTWYEVGVGGNFSIAKGTQAYMNVEKTFGDKIKTPWQWNAGVRWNF